jgi:single-strand DNA-binding protein
MSKDLNLCQFIGRLGRDPETRMAQNGTPIVSLALAVGDDYKDKAGQKVEQTEWVRCVAFGKLSEVISTYCTKGSKLYVSGKFKTRSYEKDGQTVYATEVVINEMQLLDSRNGGPAEAQQQPARQAAPSRAPAKPADFDDPDIPF